MLFYAPSLAFSRQRKLNGCGQIIPGLTRDFYHLQKLFFIFGKAEKFHTISINLSQDKQEMNFKF